MKAKLIAWMSVLLLICCAAASALGDEPLWLCPECGQSNSAFFQFCPHCGAQQPDRLVCPDCGYTMGDTAFLFCPLCGADLHPDAAPTPLPQLWGLTIDNLSTRSGPSTAFTELGTYRVKNEYVHILSYCKDSGGVIWVQCEVAYGGSKRRVYTGLKRFDASTVPLEQLRDENAEDWIGSGRLAHADAVLRYGPGTEYGVCKRETATADVAVITAENGWAQVQFVCDDPLWRVWVPESEIIYDQR